MLIRFPPRFPLVVTKALVKADPHPAHIRIRTSLTHPYHPNSTALMIAAGEDNLETMKILAIADPAAAHVLMRNEDGDTVRDIMMRDDAWEWWEADEEEFLEQYVPTCGACMLSWLDDAPRDEQCDCYCTRCCIDMSICRYSCYV